MREHQHPATHIRKQMHALTLLGRQATSLGFPTWGATHYFCNPRSRGEPCCCFARPLICRNWQQSDPTGVAIHCKEGGLRSKAAFKACGVSKYGLRCVYRRFWRGGRTSYCLEPEGQTSLERVPRAQRQGHFCENLTIGDVSCKLWWR